MQRSLLVALAMLLAPAASLAVPTTAASDLLSCTPDVKVAGSAEGCIAIVVLGQAKGNIALVGAGDGDCRGSGVGVTGVGASNCYLSIVGYGCATGMHPVEGYCNKTHETAAVPLFPPAAPATANHGAGTIPTCTEGFGQDMQPYVFVSCWNPGSTDPIFDVDTRHWIEAQPASSSACFTLAGGCLGAREGSYNTCAGYWSPNTDDNVTTICTPAPARTDTSAEDAGQIPACHGEKCIGVYENEYVICAGYWSQEGPWTNTTEACVPNPRASMTDANAASADTFSYLATIPTCTEGVSPSGPEVWASCWTGDTHRCIWGFDTDPSKTRVC